MDMVIQLLSLLALQLFQTTAGEIGTENAIIQLTKRMDSFEADNEKLSTENAELKERIKVLEILTSSQQDEIKRLVSLSEEQADSIKRLEELLQEDFSEQTVPSKRLTERTLQKARTISRIQRANNEVSVSFFATLSDHIDNPGVHQVVAFENVITNIGNAYNEHAGDFRAPVSGIYVFSTTLMAGTSAQQFHFQIVRNGKAVSNIYIPNGGTASQEAVLHLSQGDDVAIHNLDAGNRVYGHGYTSFSGFLLQQDIAEVGLVGK
ncbi:Complement C1q-like protein 4 [Mactra antiquata]